MTNAALMIHESQDWHDAALPTVLIVDDEAATAEELGEAMALDGLHCLIAATADDAHRILRQTPSITLLIVDFFLDGLGTGRSTGLDLVEQVRRALPTRDLDCVVMSADPGVLADCTVFGTLKFLPKPVLPESVRAMMRSGTFGRPGARPPDDAVCVLQERLRQQNSAIAQLSERLVAERRRSETLSARIDQMLGAASLLRNSCTEPGQEDTRALADYIHLQSAEARQIFDGADAGAMRAPLNCSGARARLRIACD